MGRFIRRLLDGLYRGAGAVAALCLVAIVVLVVLQWSSRILGVTFSAGTDFAGYAMAAASFMGFAYTLNHSAHIRVTLALSALGRGRYVAELWCFAFGAVLTTWLAWQAYIFTWQSWRFNDLATAPHATPLWMPQTLMTLGSVIFAICFWDNLASLLLRGRSNVVETSVEDAPADPNRADPV